VAVRQSGVLTLKFVWRDGHGEAEIEMSPKTSDNESLSPKKHPLRLQLPADDAIVDAFMAAQGARFQSQAIVMLIRMWVNEFGATNVMEQTMGALTASSLKERVSATQATAAQLVTAPKQPEVPEPRVPAKPTPPPTRPASSPPTPPTSASPSDDFEDLFRKRNS
jgi:hypothetical protein